MLPAAGRSQHLLRTRDAAPRVHWGRFPGRMLTAGLPASGGAPVGSSVSSSSPLSTSDPRSSPGAAPDGAGAGPRRDQDGTIGTLFQLESRKEQGTIKCNLKQGRWEERAQSAVGQPSPEPWIGRRCHRWATLPKGSEARVFFHLCSWFSGSNNTDTILLTLLWESDDPWMHLRQNKGSKKACFDGYTLPIDELLNSLFELKGSVVLLGGCR